MKAAMRITTSGDISMHDLDSGEYQVLSTGVGGLIEPIELSATLTLWLNEEGKIHGLPHNPFAQQLWDEVFGSHTDYLVGDVVLTGGTDSDGNTIGLTEDQVRTIEMEMCWMNLQRKAVSGCSI